MDSLPNSTCVGGCFAFSLDGFLAFQLSLKVGGSVMPRVGSRLEQKE